MRKIIAITQVTLDGVMQAPGGPEEDPRNGFTHGGWAMPAPISRVSVRFRASSRSFPARALNRGRISRRSFSLQGLASASVKGDQLAPHLGPPWNALYGLR